MALVYSTKSRSLGPFSDVSMAIDIHFHHAYDLSRQNI